MENSKKLTKREIIFIVIIGILTGISGVFCGLFIHSAVKKSNQTNNEQVNFFQQYWNEHVLTFGVENINFSHGQIAFIGDSITDGYHLDDYYSDLDVAVYNRGIGGDTTGGILNRIKVSLFDIEPSKIVLMIGINDINGNVPVETVTANYKNILDQIKSNLPNTMVYTMSILPLGDLLAGYVDVDTNNGKVLEANRNIQSLAQEKGYTYLDLHSLVKKENGRLKDELTGDGIHLNAAGYTIWTDLVKPYLQ